MRYLIAGLGNIGTEYANTRHNIGFMALDHFAEKHKFDFESSRYSFQAELKYRSHKLHFIKPTTYMNLSGKAIRYWLNEKNIPIENLLVITDDIALPFAKTRMKPGGSHGGHNGLKNIEEYLENRNFPRLRIGVGDNYPKGQQVQYVLSPFNKEEEKELPFLVQRASDIVFSFVDIGIERTMNFFN
ncbi:aminoacyl-tRNA hydrolase [Hyphobacterium sp. CCMP332]|nr:aminoacyl-tRNA hydrolase [Hyphobacterium sp. CCMP332]